MVLQELEGFLFAMALDLNMGYYTIRFDPDTLRICTIIFPWVKYSYKRLRWVLQVLLTFFKVEANRGCTMETMLHLYA